LYHIIVGENANEQAIDLFSLDANNIINNS